MSLFMEISNHISNQEIGRQDRIIKGFSNAGKSLRNPKKAAKEFTTEIKKFGKNVKDNWEAGTLLTLAGIGANKVFEELPMKVKLPPIFEATGVSEIMAVGVVSTLIKIIQLKETPNEA